VRLAGAFFAGAESAFEDVAFFMVSLFVAWKRTPIGNRPDRTQPLKFV